MTKNNTLNTPRRLFIFAAYDPANNHNGVIDESLIMYVRALAALGDIVFYMDNDTTSEQLSKIRSYTMYAGANRHGEYDFGSYKRGYIWARDNNIIQNYDWVYMVNDSVYGPLRPILAILTDLESRGADATGMVLNAHKTKPHIQSWFIGIAPRVFLSEQFDAFIRGVTHQDKGMVTWLYENGFTRMMIEHGGTYSCKFNVRGHAVYNKIKHLFNHGFPFFKKTSFIRKHGALGRQVLYVLNHIDPAMRTAIIENAKHVYGAAHVKRFLTNNPIKIIWRNIKHTLVKIFKEGI